MRAGKSSSGAGAGATPGGGVTLGESLQTAAVGSAELLVANGVLERDLLQVFSGTFSFCAAVSTEIMFTVEAIPETAGADAVGASMFFCFFFLLTLEQGGSMLGVGLVEVTEGLLLPPLTVSREEMSSMVGTERNSCCVIPPLSSSDREGE